MVSLPGEWWGFVILGVCVGIFSGTLGVGGGTVVIPALVLLWGIGQKSAQGMSLAIMVPMALIGALRYWKNPQVEFNGWIIALIVLGAVAGTLAGTELAARLPASILRKIFAVFLMIVAVQMFRASPRSERAPARGQTDVKAIDLGRGNDSAAQQ